MGCKWKQLVALALCLTLIGTVAPVEAEAAGGGAQENAWNQAVAEKLSKQETAVVDILYSYICAVSAGEISSTVFEIPVSDLGLEQLEWTAQELGVASIISGSAITQEAVNAVSEMIALDLDAVVYALQAKCPFDMYWYDKLAGVSTYGPSVTAYYDPGKGCEVIGLIESIEFSFSVCKDCSDGDYTVSADAVAAAKAASDCAKAIVSKYSGKTDHEKLSGYIQEICALASYNHNAAAGGVAFGGPWQATYVFDQDADTKVVCEGYAKAFQYLCDLTTFSGDVSCCRVTGAMTGGTGAGPHMWNIVKMEDGRNYLVDVTNCDDGTIGAPDLLFLAGYAGGSVQNGYTYSCGDRGNILFVYDSITRRMLGDAALAMADSQYAGAPASVTLSGSITSYNDGAAKVTVELLNGNGTVVYATTVTGNSAQYTLTDVAAGSYTLKVSKANHATASVAVTVEAETVQRNVKICPIGDVTGDGKVTATDYSRLLAHVKKTSTITDAYVLACADVTGEGKITATDYSRLLAHVKKVSPLW